MVAPRIVMPGGRRIVDPYWNDVVLLCDFDGSDGSTTFIDRSASAHTLTANGDAQLDTAQKKFGTASLLLDGTGDYVTAPDSADWHLSGDFTIEAHIRIPSAIPADTSYVVCGQRSGSTGWLSFVRDVSGTKQMGFAGPSTALAQNFAFAADTWYHLAWVRSSNTLYMFVDGTMLGTGNAFTDTIADYALDFAIGQNLSGASPFNGWIDNPRITKGVARYTANFTPPDRAFPTR